MFSWITEWFTTVYYGPGPARNAPNNGVNIKKFIEEKPPHVKIVTSEEIQQTMEKLKPVTGVEKAAVYTSPLLTEINSVFDMGYQNYFQKKKSQPKLATTL